MLLCSEGAALPKDAPFGSVVRRSGVQLPLNLLPTPSQPCVLRELCSCVLRELRSRRTLRSAPLSGDRECNSLTTLCFEGAALPKNLRPRRTLVQPRCPEIGSATPSQPFANSLTTFCLLPLNLLPTPSQPFTHSLTTFYRLPYIIFFFIIGMRTYLSNRAITPKKMRINVVSPYVFFAKAKEKYLVIQPLNVCNPSFTLPPI